MMELSMHRARPRPLVLVVEDLEWIREGMIAQLRAHGYDVAEAADADAALPLAERLRPALVLTEEELPTYAELAERLARHPALSRVPVVIINPDAVDGARHGDAILLHGYDLIEQLLAKSI